MAIIIKSLIWTEVVATLTIVDVDLLNYSKNQIPVLDEQFVSTNSFKIKILTTSNICHNTHIVNISTQMRLC